MSQPATEVAISHALAFEPLGRGRQALLDTTESVLYDATLWSAYQDSLRPLQPFKPVNFEQEMVVMAALPVPSGGYDLRFELIETTEQGLMVHYRLYAPGTDCRATLGSSVVFQAVRVARMEGPVLFEREVETLRCTEHKY